MYTYVQDISLPAVTYPSLDQPPSYDEGGEAGVGQLIDLGLDTPGTSSTAVPPPLPQGGDTDLLGQLSELGTYMYRYCIIHIDSRYCIYMYIHINTVSTCTCKIGLYTHV